MPPIADAMALLRETGAKQVIVAFSGGKDSLCVMDLCARAFGPENVRAYFWYMVKGLRCQEEMLAIAKARWGVDVIRVPNPGLIDRLRDGRLTPARSRITAKLSHRDLMDLVRRRTGVQWIASGERKADSLMRRGMLSACNGCWHKFSRVFPLQDWRVADVLSYLKARHIPEPHRFGRESRTAGVGDLGISRPEHLDWLRAEYPDDYRKVLEVFPWAESIRHRNAEREKHGWTPTDDSSEETGSEVSGEGGAETEGGKKATRGRRAVPGDPPAADQERAVQSAGDRRRRQKAT